MPAPSLRLIKDNIKDATGSGIDCTITLTYSAFTTYDGFSMAGGQLPISVKGGALNVNLSPSTYAVQYSLPRGQTSNKTWTVPQSAGPFKIADIES